MKDKRVKIEDVLRCLPEDKIIPKGGYLGMGSCCDYTETDSFNKALNEVRQALENLGKDEK